MKRHSHLTVSYLAIDLSNRVRLPACYETRKYGIDVLVQISQFRRVRLYSALLVAVLFLIGSPRGYTAEGRGQGLPIVYSDVTDGVSKLDKEAQRIYATKFHILEVTQKNGFIPAQLKGGPMIMGTPSNQKEHDEMDRAVCLFIVTADGRIIEPRMATPTSPGASEKVMRSFPSRRYVAARFSGKPVACLDAASFRYGR